MKTYSLIGIGIGPFNLGLAALTEPLTDMSTLFFDQSESFDWHPGLMLPNATLQVPFMADLVTLADPTNKYTFLNFCKLTERIYPFYIRENFNVLRKEYNCYCQWVATQLTNVRFGHEVTGIEYDNNLYAVTVRRAKNSKPEIYYAERLALGTGTQPYMPAFIDRSQTPNVIHTSQYLTHKKKLLESSSVAVIGSGQSAAEIFQDLLPFTQQGMQVNWFTRSPRFYPMEYSKLTLELTSPEYVDYFYNLPEEKRKKLLMKQNALYKGINYDLINDIFDQLYEMSVDNVPLPVNIRSNMRLENITPAEEGGTNELLFTETEQQEPYRCKAGFVVLATGYKYREPAFLAGIANRINRQPDGLFRVQRDYTIDVNGDEIFVQNAELHTHGFVTPDLGMGAYRNAHIINKVSGREVYQIEKRIAFQTFGAEKTEQLAPVYSNII
ncbi:lysine N(6)-hydroxylase/L-ornithine N(5)-oxygenase family protein [Niastella populi]|uniref:Alcaligin biosynthesis protein n=1 Tax=Niastella populi TaxID=550983 RepID=A0A1V9FE50_9BACT|nr:SidA/IucD/PvdA family monooxygenase [Niastella populi]OQP56645.1 alcaligin biosynthesis protein [Niastella populi]